MTSTATRTRARAISAPVPPASPAPRARGRAINLTPPAAETVQNAASPLQPVAAPPALAGQITDEQKGVLNDHIGKWNEANLEKNRHTRDEKAAAGVVEKTLREAGAKSYSASVTFGGKTRTVEARIGNKTGTALNMTKLRTLVDDATFMKIVGATQDAVTQHAGTNVLTMISETVTVPDCFSLKGLK